MAVVVSALDGHVLVHFHRRGRAMDGLDRRLRHRAGDRPLPVAGRRRLPHRDWPSPESVSPRMLFAKTFAYILV